MSNGINLITLLRALIWLMAGTGLYLTMTNRSLSLMRDEKLKGLLLFSGGILLVLTPPLISFMTSPVWMILPLMVLVYLSTGEARRLYLSRSQRGSSLVSSTPFHLRITHPVTTRELVERHYRIDHPGFQDTHLRIAHLSDMHLNHYLPEDYYLGVMDKVNAWQPDVVLITGDFVTDIDNAPRLPAILENLKPKIGVYASLGNHDYWAGVDSIASALRASNVILVNNHYEQIELNTGRRVKIYSCNLPWSSSPMDMLPGDEGDLNLVLSHTADNIDHLARLGANIVFSGHYHAGQFCLPWLGPVVIPSRYGRRFSHGHYKIAGADLFVTAGIGANTPPVRLYCPPDFFVIDVNKPSHATCTARRITSPLKN